MNIHFNRQFSDASQSINTVPQPNARTSQTALVIPQLTKSPTVHSYGSYGSSSNYITMKNVEKKQPFESFHAIRDPSQQFHTIRNYSTSQKPLQQAPLPNKNRRPIQIPDIPIPKEQYQSHESESHIMSLNLPSSNYTFHPSQNKAYRINSNVVNQQVLQHMPLSQAPVKSQQFGNSHRNSRHVNDTIFEQEQLSSYKSQYFQWKNAYQLLKERYDHLIVDYDTLRQKSRVVQNNQEYSSINNQQLTRKNISLQNRAFQLEQQLKAAKMHNGQLMQQLHNNSNVNQMVTMTHNDRNYTNNLQGDTLGHNGHLVDYYQPSLKQLQHQNRQLLYRTQEYESTILFKNSQIQKYRAQSQNKEIQNSSLKRQLQTFGNRQKIYLQEEKLTKKYMVEVNSIPSLKQCIERFKRENQELTQTNNTQIQFSQKNKNLQQKLEIYEGQNNEYLQRIKQLQENIGYLQRPKPINQNTPHDFSKVLTTYIGEDDNYHELQSQQDNLSFSRLNQTLYKNLKSLSKNQTQPTKDKSNLEYRLADGLYNNYGINTTNSNQNANNQPMNLAQRLADSMYSNKDKNQINYNKSSNNQSMNLTQRLTNGIILQQNNQQQVNNKNTKQINMAIRQSLNKLVPPGHLQQNNRNTDYDDRLSNLKIQDEAFYDFSKENTKVKIGSGQPVSHQVNQQQPVLNDHPQIYNDDSMDRNSQFRQSPRMGRNANNNLSRLYQTGVQSLQKEASHDILQYPQLPFQPKQNNFVQHRNMLNQISQKHPHMNNHAPVSQHHSYNSDLRKASNQNHQEQIQLRRPNQHRIFRRDDSQFLDQDNQLNQSNQSNQSGSLQTLQRRIVELAGQNKSLRKFLTKKNNQTV